MSELILIQMHANKPHTLLTETEFGTSLEKHLMRMAFCLDLILISIQSLSHSSALKIMKNENKINIVQENSLFFLTRKCREKV